jgi:hypothetical protein
MRTVAEIEAAIEKLSSQERQQLRERLLQRAQLRPSLWGQLRSMAGTVKGLPEDFAANHDHYLHGQPKRVP